MPTTITNTTEQLALDGPIGLSLTIALAIALLGFFAWALWRERSYLARSQLVLFWILRAAALGTVCWMLLAPHNRRVETSTTRRAVAIVADITPSMQTIDPAGTADELRWAVSGRASKQFVATVAADRAVAAIGVAQRYLLEANEALRQHKPESVVVNATSAANDGIRRARANVELIYERSATSGASRALAQRLLAVLDGPDFQAFDALCRSLRRGRMPPQKDWRESLPDLEQTMSGVRRTLAELASLEEAADRGKFLQQSPGLMTSLSSTSRIARAASFLGQLEDSTLAAIRANVDVQVSYFDETVALLSEQESPKQLLTSIVKRPAEDGGTDLSLVLDHLRQERQDQPLAAVFMLTDAAHNQGNNDPRETAASLGDTPVYVVPIGNTRHVRDVTLQSVYAPGVAMRNDDIVIEATLQAYECAGEVCIVELLQDGEVVDFREVPLDSGFVTRTVRFDQNVPSVGNQSFQLAVTPLEGETTESNNYREVEVNVTRSDIKVLLADELPRWEYRYLSQLFRRDQKVECDELLFHPRLIATGRREPSKTVPITVDEWDQYDVVLLGDLPPEHFPVAAQESLAEYLRQRGGTLVIIAGSDAMPQSYTDHPLHELLPVAENLAPSSVDERGFAFRVTAEGRSHQALLIGETESATRLAWDFVNRYAPLHQLSNWRRPLPSARTLIAAVPRNRLDEPIDSAFLCWQPIGRGRVVYLSGPDTYRLRFLRGDRLHHRFWGQLLRWAIANDLSAGTELVRVRTNKSRYGTREEVGVTVTLIDAEREPVLTDGVEATITSSDETRTVPMVAVADIPGQYHTTIRSLPPGVFRIEPTGSKVTELLSGSDSEPASASFTIQAELPAELADTRCDRALAQQIAGVTGGQVIPPTAVSEVLELTNLEPIVTETVERRPLWLEWKYLWLVFICLQVEWGVRKWKGLS